MKTLLHAITVCVLLMTATAVSGIAQTMSPEAMIRQILLAHIGPNGLPSDFVIQGQVTDSSGTRSLRMQVKGKDQIRYEQPQGTKTNIAIYNAGLAWAGPAGSLKPLFQFAAVRRPMELPFLDVIVDIGDPHWKARYIGQEALGSATVLHFAVHFSDPIPLAKRSFNRPLDEDADFFVDTKTSLIVRSQRMQAADNSMDFRVPFVLDFSDYRQVNGLMIPFHIVNTIGNRYSGIRQVIVVFQSVLINQGIPDSAFRPQ